MPSFYFVTAQIIISQLYDAVLQEWEEPVVHGVTAQLISDVVAAARPAVGRLQVVGGYFQGI
jgi:hypothetical protein